MVDLQDIDIAQNITEDITPAQVKMYLLKRIETTHRATPTRFNAA